MLGGWFLFLRPTTVPEPDAQKSSSELGLTGEALARAHCQVCHLFPEPELLDRKTWKEHVLPEMKARMGLNPLAVEKHEEASYLKASGAYREYPMVSEEQWKLIEAYYLAAAPETIKPAAVVTNIDLRLPGFRVEFPPSRLTCPAATLTWIDTKRGQILLGDMERKTLGIFNALGELWQLVPMDNAPVWVLSTQEGIFVTSIGQFTPSDIPKGNLAFLPRIGEKYGSPKVILKDLPRPTHTTLGDLNGDGRDDLIVSMFGNNTGRLSWFELLENGEYREHVLLRRPGVIQTELADINGDGFVDIIALIAQEYEAMEIFYNDGKGEFQNKRIFQKHPLFGHTHFQLIDFNGDQLQDLLVVNGDNGEYKSSLKPYHGVRIYLNRGQGKFEESSFFPINGAYRAIAADFDEDGDLDIAVISYFPDYTQFPRESFVYLENRGSSGFVPLTFREVAGGRWITMDAGDLDGDGDIDLVLGSNSHGPIAVPPQLYEDWETTGPSFIILRNLLRD